MGLISKLLNAAWDWNNRPRAMTPIELLNLLRRMQSDDASPGEWDYFQSVALADDRLEKIRQEVAPIYGPGFDPRSDQVLASAIIKTETLMSASPDQEQTIR